jgi:beta-galactosidase
LDATRRIVRLADGWRFYQGQQDQGASPDLDDSGWRDVRVPHDWAIELDHDSSGDSNTKFNWRGEGWYRYHFTPGSSDQGRRFWLDFDGVMAFPKVYVNGHLAGEWDYGYNSFRVDATPYLKFDEDNVIAVQVDTRKHASRWYPGAGIYRKVILTIADPVHIAHWGTFVTTPRVSEDEALVKVATTIGNQEAEAIHVTLRTRIFTKDGRREVVATQVSETDVPRQASANVQQTLTLRKPQLWDIGSPNLYAAETQVEVNGEVRDRYNTIFGVRTVEFTKDNGFLLNGRRVQLRGANIHHDLGPLGAAFHRRAAQRQLQIMQDMGVNAVRFSHNPPAPEVLDLADAMGIVVFAECFDKWDQTADRLPEVDLNGFAERQISQFIRRDRNHPSVMIWSIGNEIWDIEVNLFGGSAEQVGTIASYVRANDPTRPVTMATHLTQAVNTGLLRYLDVQSWNYGRKYVEGRASYPDMPVIMSESASAVSTRGEYRLPLPKYKDDFLTSPVVSSYDLNSVSWGDIADTEFANLDVDSYVAGEFVWTGIDYIGEPTPFEKVARSSYFGAVDLVGLPKDRFYLYRSYWNKSADTTHLLPHWNWPDRIGKSVPVMAYTSGDAAELFLNGRSLGRQIKFVPPIKLPPNLAKGKLSSASSEELSRGNLAQQAVDANTNSRWSAADGSPKSWWQVDLGENKSVRTVHIDFEQDSANYQYVIKGSLDGKNWQQLAGKRHFNRDDLATTHALEAETRYLRVEFVALKPGTWASIREFEAYEKPVDRSYYGVTRAYRLRWDDVPYEPGELRLVSFKGETKLGETVVRTAAPPTRISLTPDRNLIAADGDDLSFVTVEAKDSFGTVDPDGSQLVSLELKGPGEVVGVGNGDPNSQDRMVAKSVRLFHGKAVVILRGRADAPGELTLSAFAAGLETATSHVTAK